MHTHEPTTLKQYYLSFWSTIGVVAAAPPLLAGIVSALLPQSKAVLLFPPLGDVTPLARLGLLASSLIAVQLIYFWEGGKWPMVASAVIGVCCLCLYIALFMRFVIRIDVPNHDAVYVSVGYKHTAFAASTFPAESDENMLRGRGINDEEIRKLWTFKSLAIARLCLFLSFCGCILGWVVAFSLGVLFDLRSRIIG